MRCNQIQEFAWSGMKSLECHLLMISPLCRPRRPPSTYVHGQQGHQILLLLPLPTVAKSVQNFSSAGGWWLHPTKIAATVTQQPWWPLNSEAELSTQYCTLHISQCQQNVYTRIYKEVRGCVHTSKTFRLDVERATESVEKYGHSNQASLQNQLYNGGSSPLSWFPSSSKIVEKWLIIDIDALYNIFLLSGWI
jgi:hypothetical protein